MRELNWNINELDRELSALAVKNSRHNTVPRLPFHIKREVQLFEGITTNALDWGNLASWLDHARGTLNDHKRNFQILSEFGVDIKSLSRRNHEFNLTEIPKSKFESNPQLKLISTTFGPNYSSCFEQIEIMSGVSHDNPIPLEKVQPNIEDTAEQIMGLWKGLRERQKEVECFKEKWSGMQTAERRAWLQNTRRLHQEPDIAISLLAQHSGTAPSDREAFMTPLLNVEDLAQANVLPHWLQTRLTIHPKRFLSTDSRLVSLGYWCGALKLLGIDGRISLYTDPGEESPTNYRIQFHANAFKMPCAQNPAIAIYQLRAQKSVYEFLVYCVSDALKLPMLDGHLSDSTYSGTSLSLLTRSALLDYRRPDCTDWSYLQNVLEASADEALDDLWRLRTDAQFWLMRIMQVRNNTSILLSSVFYQIDTFLCLSEEIKRIRLNSGWVVSSVPCDHRGLLEEMISLDRVFRFSLNKALESMQKLVRSSEWITQGTKTLCYLFDMMKYDDPTLRVIGLRTVLRTIEREMSKVNFFDSIPFGIEQTLNDMSVVAVCMQETAKHCQYIRCFDHEYASFANDAEMKWNERESPWILLIESTLRKLGGKVNKLNIFISNEKESLENRHRSFWEIVDQCMCENETFKYIVDTIRRDAPIPAAAPTFATEAPSNAWSTPGTELAVTRTQEKRAKGRKVQPNTSRSLRRSATASPVVKTPSLPVIYVRKEKDKDFWNRLSKDKGQETFHSWKSFLQNIGFTLTPQLGSGRRFEWRDDDKSHHAIVFHEPHGQNGNNVPRYQAREWWARRLEDHFQVIVEW